MKVFVEIVRRVDDQEIDEFVRQQRQDRQRVAVNGFVENGAEFGRSGELDTAVEIGLSFLDGQSNGLVSAVFHKFSVLFLPI